MYGSTMVDERLSSLTGLTIKVDFPRSLDFDDSINDFEKILIQKILIF